MYICISGHFESRVGMCDSDSNNENYYRDKYSQNVNTQTGYLQKNANMCKYQNWDTFQKDYGKVHVCIHRQTALDVSNHNQSIFYVSLCHFRGRNNHTRVTQEGNQTTWANGNHVLNRKTGNCTKTLHV